MKQITVFGLGYIGLPTAAILASKKCKVLGIDINQSIINLVNNGEIHIAEPGLKKLVKKSVALHGRGARLDVEEALVFRRRLVTQNHHCKMI